MKRVLKIGSLLCMLLFLTSNSNAQSVDNNYVIKKGDVVSIAVMGHPEFSLERIIVLPDGYVQFPGLGSIQASGMTVKSFTKLVTDNVGKYVLNPIVTVFISELPSQIVNVIGYVNRPGQVPVFEKISIMDAISRAGGIKFIKRCKKIIIIRADQSYEEISVKDIYSDDITKRKFKLLDIGDTVYVVEPNEINWSKLSFFTSLGYIIISIIRMF
ncbi:MAG: polysaccharide biosynthesis/export family protein [Paludibacter sp.]